MRFQGGSGGGDSGVGGGGADRVLGVRSDGGVEPHPTLAALAYILASHIPVYAQFSLFRSRTDYMPAGVELVPGIT